MTDACLSSSSSHTLGPYLLGPNSTPENGIYTGDARELAKLIPDESVDLVFSDPIYDRIDDYRWLAETAARVLKTSGACLAYPGIGYLPEILGAMSEHLRFRWQFIEYRTNEVKHRPAPGGKCVYSPILWFDVGASKPDFVLDVRALAVFSDSSNHSWSKPILAIKYYLTAFTHSGAIVLDPFTGGGTVPAVCKMLGRNYLAFEIDPTTADNARRRVEMTQPPLFVLQPEQMEIPLE